MFLCLMIQGGLKDQARTLVVKQRLLLLEKQMKELIEGRQAFQCSRLLKSLDLCYLSRQEQLYLFNKVCMHTLNKSAFFMLIPPCI